MLIIMWVLALPVLFVKNVYCLFQNIWLGVRSMFFCAPKFADEMSTQPQFSVGQLVALLILNQVVLIWGQLSSLRLPVEFNPSAIPLMLAIQGLVFLWSFFALSSQHRTRFVAFMIGLLSLSLWMNVAQLRLSKKMVVWRPMLESWHPDAALFVYYFPLLYMVFVLAYLSVKWMGRRWMAYPWWLGVWCAFGFAYYYLNTKTDYQPWFYEVTSPASAEPQEPAKDYTPAYREQALYQQPRLLEEAIAKVAPGKLNVPELFLLGFAGDATQDVFMREVLAVERQFSTQFHTAQHQLLLINNLATLTRYPMASVTSLRLALNAIGKRMNPEDVLMLFMTSHGSRDHQFYLSFGGYHFDVLNPTILKQLLDDAHIKHRILVISACYSGGFIPLLANDHTLIMTAARADRTSFGCANENDWTYFGQALFDHGLKHTSSLIKAFELARQEVRRRESLLNITPSEPQISIGSKIPAILKAFE